jgi:hypothetical protein
MTHGSRKPRYDHGDTRIAFMDAEDATASASWESATKYVCARSLDDEDDPAPKPRLNVASARDIACRWQSAQTLQTTRNNLCAQRGALFVQPTQGGNSNG